MTIQEYIKEKARVLLVPGVGVRYLTEEDVINLYSHIIQKDIERMEIEMKHWIKHSSGNYADGAVEAINILINKKRKELEELNENV